MIWSVSTFARSIVATRPAWVVKGCIFQLSAYDGYNAADGFTFTKNDVADSKSPSSERVPTRILKRPDLIVGLQSPFQIYPLGGIGNLWALALHLHGRHGFSKPAEPREP